VFLFIRPSNPAWYPTIVASVVANFPGADFYLANGPASSEPFSRIPGSRRDLCESLRRVVLGPPKYRQIGFSLRPDTGERFLVKLALGLGALFLGEQFVSSVNAGVLRSLMWEKDSVKRADIGARDNPLFPADANPVKADLAWSPGHLLALIPVKECLVLAVVLYGDQVGTMMVSSNRADWEGRVHSSGQVFVVAPGLRRFAGPLTLEAYRAGKLRADKGPADFQKLVLQVNSLPPKPPFELSG